VSNRMGRLLQSFPFQRHPKPKLQTNSDPFLSCLSLQRSWNPSLHTQVYKYLEHHFILHEAQCGFRPGHCTQDVFLKTVDDWRCSLEKMKSLALLLLTLARHLIPSATRFCCKNYHCMGSAETRYNGSKAACMVGDREWYLVGQSQTGLMYVRVSLKDPSLSLFFLASSLMT